MTSTDVLSQEMRDHDRRIENVEDSVSETRKVVVGVDKSLAGVMERLKTLEKLVFATILGIGALVGTEIWHNILNGR